MNKIFYLITGVFMLLLMCCGNHHTATISGHLEGAAGKTIYLERFVNSRGVKTDSTVIDDNGNFSITPRQPLEMNFYRLILSDRDFIVLITDSTESIHIEGTADDINLGATVTGSPNTNQLREFEQNCQNIFNKEIKASEKLRYPDASREQKDQYRKEIADAREELYAFVRQWLDVHTDAPAALAAVQILDMRTDWERYKKVITAVERIFGHSTHYKMLKQKVENMAAAPEAQPGSQDAMPSEAPQAAVMKGKAPPEIALPDPNGTIRKLSDLKGKVVLIDFWASWCGPCRRENPNVVQYYKKYHDAGFEVFSVSLDRDAAAWKSAIQQDGLIWPNHVSDLQFWNSKAAIDYNVNGIPFPVLMDRDGKVVAYGSDVRGELLETQLKKLLAQ